MYLSDKGSCRGVPCPLFALSNEASTAMAGYHCVYSFLGAHLETLGDRFDVWNPSGGAERLLGDRRWGKKRCSHDYDSTSQSERDGGSDRHVFRRGNRDRAAELSMAKCRDEREHFRGHLFYLFDCQHNESAE